MKLLGNISDNKDITNKEYNNSNFIASSLKGAVNGVAELGADGKVPSSQLPAFSDTVVNGYYYDGSFYSDALHTNLIIPSTGKLYIDLINNKFYDWNGNSYVELTNYPSSMYVSNITGNGTSTEFTVVHNLNTKDVIVNIYETTNDESVLADVKRVSESTIKITFEDAPANNESFRVMVVALINQDRGQSENIATLTAIDSYSSLNDNTTYLTNAPFIITREMQWYPEEFLVKSIKLKIKETGTLSFGYMNGYYASEVSTATFNMPITVNLTELGEQTIILDKPYLIPSGCSFAIAQTTDTAKWAYGQNGKYKGFTGTNANYSPNSLGITVYGEYIYKSIKTSPYNNKRLSILGDSISTYDGFIPSGNVTYYPAGDVQDVSDTWWYKLTLNLGMSLEKNNSWSGSRVTTTAGDTSAGCMTRCTDLGNNPDIIIVYMGINDFNNEVALGTYDGKSTVPSTTTTFREAYGVMLNKILTAYPTSEVWVCTLPQEERNGSTGFPEINGNNVPLVDFNEAIKELAFAFGVKVLDLHKCGLTYQNMSVYNPDNLHPNPEGHTLIAKQCIRQINY